MDLRLETICIALLLTPVCRCIAFVGDFPDACDTGANDIMDRVGFLNRLESLINKTAADLSALCLPTFALAINLSWQDWLSNSKRGCVEHAKRSYIAAAHSMKDLLCVSCMCVCVSESKQIPPVPIIIRINTKRQNTKHRTQTNI